MQTNRRNFIASAASFVAALGWEGCVSAPCDGETLPPWKPGLLDLHFIYTATLIENVTFNGIQMDGIYAHPLRAVISPSKKTLVADVRDIRFSNVHATALELPLVSGRSGNPLKRFSFTDCTFRKVSDAELPGWERHGPAVWERVRQTTFEHVEGFTYTNTRFDAP